MLTLAILATLLAPALADTSFTLRQGAIVRITSQEENVTVRSGTGNVVQIRGGRAVFDAKSLRVRATARTLEVTVPSWATVDVESVDGDFVFDGPIERLTAETINGSIRFTRGAGRAELATVVGGITITDFRGTQLHVDAIEGEVSVVGATGDISVESVNNNVSLRGIRSTSVKAGTVNGELTFGGVIAPDGTYELESHNGDMTLFLVPDVSARLDITTFNGDFSTEIRAVTQPSRDGRRAKNQGEEKSQTFTYGKGEGRISIDSFNGNIQVRRGTGN